MIAYGIIGAGRLGNTHAKSLSQMQGVKLAAVYDIDPAKSQAMHDTYGAEICNSAEELAAKVDVVIVSTPSDCHIDGVRAAIKAGKHVFSEKPLCRFASQAADYREMVKGFDKTCGIGFVRRHMYKTLKCKELLDSGVIGRIKFCNVDLPFGGFKRMYGDWFVDYQRSGGVILDMLAHHIDLANYFFGRPVRAYAQSMMLDPKQELPSDYVSATVTYESGVIVNLMCTWQRFGRSGEMMEIYGDKGAVTMTGADALKLVKLGEPEQSIDVSEKAQSTVNNASTGNGFMNELVDFTECVRTGKKYAPGLEDGFASFAVAEAMMRSAETNQVVDIKY